MAAVPLSVIDDLIVHGSADDCRAQINDYVANGLDTPIIAALPTGTDLLETARALAPA
jgi:alkanesulfonate monooxygenase SsuD/methylene tetrahydromethanopterin reductase-like flavin-dependent oxidoreductase (luciferase family)